jgi:hypothetical protein
MAAVWIALLLVNFGNGRLQLFHASFYLMVEKINDK